MLNILCHLCSHCKNLNCSSSLDLTKQKTISGLLTLFLEHDHLLELCAKFTFKTVKQLCSYLC